jgi:hypothetical protein
LALLGRGHATDSAPIRHLEASIDPSMLHHRQLLDGTSCRKIPTYRRVDEGRLPHALYQESDILAVQTARHAQGAGLPVSPTERGFL